MLYLAKNNKKVNVRRLIVPDIERLVNYLQNLSELTKSRFGPHKFDNQTLLDLFQNSVGYRGYIAEDIENDTIIAYSIIKIGFLEHDRNRLESYGLNLNNETDCTFAPSVADSWQSSGLGNYMFDFIINDLLETEINRIILWGGVQSSNDIAKNFYKKRGFNLLGKFKYHGWNEDMLLELVI